MVKINMEMPKRCDKCQFLITTNENLGAAIRYRFTCPISLMGVTLIVDADNTKTRAKYDKKMDELYEYCEFIEVKENGDETLRTDVQG